MPKRNKKTGVGVLFQQGARQLSATAEEQAAAAGAAAGYRGRQQP